MKKPYPTEYVPVSAKQQIYDGFSSTFPAWASLATLRRASQPSFSVGYANMPLPAMKQLAPAAAHAERVQSALIPPSTSISTSYPPATMAARSSLILLSIVGM